MSTFRKYRWNILVLAAFILASCNLPGKATPTQLVPDVLYTAAAQTVEAQLTQAASGTQIVLPSLTQIPGTPTSPAPTNTPLPPTWTPLPTATLVPPTATPVPIPCNRAGFVEDISIPDGTDIAAGATFVKTWRLKNTGTCTWNSAYSLVFNNGDSMGGPASQQLTTGTVASGQNIDVSVTLKAPTTTGTYQGFWKLRDSANVIFGLGDTNKAFWVKIDSVNPATPTPTVNVTFDFIAKGPNAVWRNATANLPWGDPGDDTPGVALSGSNVKLNDNNTYPSVLATFPQVIASGVITGTYPAYTVQDGDHFKALIGFKAGYPSGQAKFRLKYNVGSTETVLGEWIKAYDGNVLSINVDLSSLKGQTVQFILAVVAITPPYGDKSEWVSPRIEH